MGLVSEENFEYTHLDDKTRNIVWQRTSEIKELMRLTAENIISIGHKLTEIKQQLGHGSFQHWLKLEFEWSEQTARQFMQVYRWSETLENKNFVFSQLGTSALYLLAAPSTPSEARKEVLNLVEVGEKISYTRAKNIIERCKETSASVEQEATEAFNTIKTTGTELRSDAFNQLFRLETPELGCIVRLYHAEELEAIAKLSIGATVRIKVGRRQGQTATIAEILSEQLSSNTDNRQTNLTFPTSLSKKRDITVRVIDEVDFSKLEKLIKMGQDLTISYGDICLVVEGNSETLTTFAEQVKTDVAFVKDIFKQALDKQPKI